MPRRTISETSTPNPDIKAGSVTLAGVNVVLAAGILPERYDTYEKPLDELKRLVETVRAKPVAEVTQKRRP